MKKNKKKRRGKLYFSPMSTERDTAGPNAPSHATRICVSNSTSSKLKLINVIDSDFAGNL